MKLLFFDLETTGLDYNKCAIIQIAAIVAEVDIKNKINAIDAINLKMKPRSDKFIDSHALEVNKFSLEEIMLWKDDHEAYLQFIEFLSKYVDKFNKIDKFYLVGYNNIKFDFDFLKQWFKDNGDKYLMSWWWPNQIDVMSEATRYLIQYRPIMNNFKLLNVAKVLEIPFDENLLHDGLYDVKLTYKIFKKIIESNTPIMPFNEQKALEIFNGQNQHE